MKWMKIGKIFTADEFAQSPQLLEFDDFVRIYYSSRTRDNEKYLSNVKFVDMTKDLGQILSHSEKPVIKLGETGSFDEHGIFPFSVYRNGKSIHALTTGWSRRKSVSVETAIGFANSKDNGLTFEKSGNGPAFTSSLNEPFLVGDAFLRHFAGKPHMWYIHGTKWIEAEQPERVYKIAHASWENWKLTRDGKQIIEDVLGEEECQALPTVIESQAYPGKYHMYFCYRHAVDFRKNKERGYRLGYAYSSNLTDWTRSDADSGIGLSEDGWDSQMMCYPHLCSISGKIYLLYNGNEFGKYGFGAAVLQDEK